MKYSTNLLIAFFICYILIFRTDNENRINTFIICQVILAVGFFIVKQLEYNNKNK